MLQAHRPIAVVLTACLWLSLARPAPAQFEELAAKVPSSANAITLLDAQTLLASPLATSEGWKEKYEQAFASGLVAISPDTERMVLAAQFDFEYMKPLWKVAIADLVEERSLPQIARATKGTLDPIGETPAVALRDDSYVVELGPKRLGAMSPANRQSVARWVRDVQSRSEPNLSPYLKGSLVASEQSQIVIAFDLEDAVPPDVIRAKLAASAAIADKQIDVDAAAKALAGVRGLALEVAVTDGTYGRLAVHFREDASVLAPVAKPLLMEILADMGAAIEDIEQWDVKAESTRIRFNGPLSAAGRKRVFSLIDNPTSAILATEPRAAPSGTSEISQEAYASQQYFKSINSVLDEVRKESKTAATFGENAMWLDRWGRQIDGLPILNVDPELLGFGQHVSMQLRNMAAALRGIGINSAERTAQVIPAGSTSVTVSGYPGYGGSYSYYNEWRDVSGERRGIRAQERATGARGARDIARELEDDTVKVRQAMTQKHKVSF